ncbi:MAG: DUF4360 domain-containing protein [Bdellovibrionota bacterium]
MKTTLIALTLLLSTQGFAQKPPSASVTSVQIDGSGCDAGSANALITSDLNYLSVLYDRFSVELGKGTANPGDSNDEKNCTIVVNINVPHGWTFDFDQVDYRGYIEVSNAGALGYQFVKAEIEGGKAFGFEQKVFKGPIRQNYVISAKNQASGIFGSLGGIGKIGGAAACLSGGQNIRVKIKSQIGVKSLIKFLKPTARLVIDSTDASFGPRLKFNWKRCGG